MTDPRRPRFHCAATVVLLSAAMLVAAGCAHTGRQEHGADAITEASDAERLAAPTTAAEMGRRFLKLIGSIKSRDELTPELIRQVTGIALDEVKPGELITGVGSGDLGGGWRYMFSFVPESVSRRPGVSVHFQHQEDRWADMSAICELDFDDYHDALKAMGFDDTPIHGEIGELREWRYYKSDFVISVVPQNVVAGQAGRVCVQAIGTLN
ncbi:hypothetical protein [Pseudoxanthomonas koreensis]|uniref:hypothetical protein n=1 Tax=Pseudoxanthomonas koreensis TaxID=266061 RepID=UPI0035A6EF00